MPMNRKDDHINSALSQKSQDNHFDHVRFIHHALSDLTTDDIDLSAFLGGKKFPLPFFINAMTGGTQQAYEINEKLALLAKHFSIPMALGSISSAIKDPTWEATYKIARKANPNGTLIANLGAEVSKETVLKAINMIDADMLQIHLNNVQEIVMPEGDRNFKAHAETIQALASSLTIPLIIKEVGFGMASETLQRLKSLGVKHIDVAGKGGTNFSIIENERRQSPFAFFNTWGLSTVESLLEAKRETSLNIIASGGIRDGLDIIKALRLGASFVGMSGYFLKLVKNNTLEEAIEEVDRLIESLKGIMTVLNAQSIKDLKDNPIVFSTEITHYMKQRNILFK